MFCSTTFDLNPDVSTAESSDWDEYIDIVRHDLIRKQAIGNDRGLVKLFGGIPRVGRRFWVLNSPGEKYILDSARTNLIFRT